MPGSARSLGAAIAIAAVLALSSCAPASDDAREAGTTVPRSVPASSPASAAAEPTSSPTSALPAVRLVTGLPEGLAVDPAAPVIPQAALITMLSEQITDAGAARVRTVECSGDLPLGGSDAVACTVTTERGAAGSGGTWQAYAARGVGGSPAILWLRGAPLSEEFRALLAGPSAVIVARAIDPAYGSSRIDAQQVVVDANATLVESGSAARLDRCEDGISFEEFEPSVCAGSAEGATIRALVLPSDFLGSDRGLLVLTQPAA